MLPLETILVAWWAWLHALQVQTGYQLWTKLQSKVFAKAM